MKERKFKSMRTTILPWKKTGLLVLLTSLFALFIISLTSLYKRACYIPDNFPKRYFKAGKGYFEPPAPSGFAFHPNQSDLYIIDSKNNLIVWDFINNSHKYRGFPNYYKNKSLKIYDVSEKHILLGLFDHNTHCDHLVIADLESLHPKRKKEIKGRLSGACFNEISVDIVYSEITRASKEQHVLQNVIEYHSWNPIKNTTIKSETCIDIDGLTTFYIQEFRITSKDGNRDILVDNQPKYTPRSNKTINTSRITINPDRIIENDFRYPVNSGAICVEKDLFCLVSSPSYMVISPLSYHYLVWPTEKLSTIFIYRYSTGEKILSESFPYYPSYYIKFSGNEKWLGVSIGGYILEAVS